MKKITINNYETRYKEYEFLIKTENNFFISLLFNIYTYIFFTLICLTKFYDLNFFSLRK